MIDEEAKIKSNFAEKIRAFLGSMETNAKSSGTKTDSKEDKEPQRIIKGLKLKGKINLANIESSRGITNKSRDDKWNDAWDGERDFMRNYYNGDGDLMGY